ncbi:MAG: hypothetical protein IPN18_13845 [Ignavibacteriales bacterium]|nr:hypothetical protein [Ignavibacteriales bacterium]
MPIKKSIRRKQKVIKFSFDRKSEKFKTLLGKTKGFASEGGTLDLCRFWVHNIWFADYLVWIKSYHLTFTIMINHTGMLEDEVTAIVEYEPGNFIFGHNSGFTLYKDRGFYPRKLPRQNERSSDIVAKCSDLMLDEGEYIWAAGFLWIN